MKSACLIILVFTHSWFGYVLENIGMYCKCTFDEVHLLLQAYLLDTFLSNKGSAFLPEY